MAGLLRTGSIVVSLVLVCTCWAQDQYCPKAIRTKQTLENAPAGWKSGSSNKQEQALAGITFFDGPPEQEASLVYDSYTKGKTADHAVWHFDRSSQIWVSCIYQGTAITLSKALPANTTECKVVYSPDVHVDGYPEIKQVICK